MERKREGSRSGSNTPKQKQTPSWTVTDAVLSPFPHLSGAVDVVTVRHKDGTLRSSPFYVRFGKYQGLLKRREKEVYITVNGVTMPWSMRLGRTGVAYFSPPLLSNSHEKKGHETKGHHGNHVGDEGIRGGGLASKSIPILGSSVDSLDVNDYSSPDEQPGSPISHMSVLDRDSMSLEETLEKSVTLDRSLSLDSNPALDMSPFHERTGTLDAYDAVDLEKARSLEMHVRTMAEAASSQQVILNANSDQEDEMNGNDKSLSIRSIETASAPTSWSSRNAVELVKLLELGTSGLKAFKHMELSMCGKELANCIIDNDKIDDDDLGEAGEEEMTADEVLTAFNSKLLSKEELEEAIRDMSGSTNRTKQEQLICRVGNIVMKWSDVSQMVMTYLAFQEYPKSCPKYVMHLQPTMPINLEWNIKKRIEKQEEKWRFFTWLSSSFKTPDKPEQQIKDADDAADISSPPGKSSDLSGDAAAAAAENSRSVFTPSPQQLEMLNLKDGRNEITFSCYSSLWGTQTASAYIYLMPWNSKVVVSDVDGTITKSDVLGHVMTAIGRDWSQTGISELFKNIRKNGYHVMYLSARSIGQAASTRDFLFNLDQNGAKLPVGPVIISPDGILPSLFREMILKRPDEFKIASLETIRELFPEDWNPFYAGFGNRPTDEISYSALGIPTSRIFTINPKGQVTLNSVKTSKTSQWCTLQGINELVYDFFPEWREDEDHVNHDKFSEYNYWKVPAVEIDIENELEKEKKGKVK